MEIIIIIELLPESEIIFTEFLTNFNNVGIKYSAKFSKSSPNPIDKTLIVLHASLHRAERRLNS